MKASRANARGTSAADARVLAALFMGVIAGALAAMMTRRPFPVSLAPEGCPVCPLSCATPGGEQQQQSQQSSRATLDSSSSTQGDVIKDCSQCPQIQNAAAADISASRSVAAKPATAGEVAGGGGGGVTPSLWWTPETAPAATGLEAGDPTLKAILEKVAINGEVLVAGEARRTKHYSSTCDIERNDGKKRILSPHHFTRAS